MQTLQDMLTVEDFDVSEAFQHSQSTESVKSASSDSYMSKANVCKRRANQHETEGFYFTVSSTARRNEKRKKRKRKRQREPARSIIRNCSLCLFLLVYCWVFFFGFFLRSSAEVQGVLERQQPHCQAAGQARPPEADAWRRYDVPPLAVE